MSGIVEMRSKKENLCRLCLKIAKNECVEVDKIMKQMLNILLLKLDLDVTRDPVICQYCVEIAKKCLNFKSICLDTERIIVSFSTFSRENTKHNIQVIYKDTKNVEAGFYEDLHICRICMTRLEKNSFASLGTLMNEATLFGSSHYLPEVDFNIIEDPIICVTCRGNFMFYLKFTKDCLDTEERIEAYCRDKGTDSMGQIRLDNVFNYILEYSAKYPRICTDREKSHIFDKTEGVYLKEYSEFIKQDEWNIKEEEINFNENFYKDLPEVRLDKYISNTFGPKKVNEEDRLNGAPIKTQDHKTKMCIYQKSNPASFIEEASSHEDKMMNESCDIEISKDIACADEMRQMNNINKNPLCTSQTQQQAVKNHTTFHKRASGHKEKTKNNSNKMHKCSLCAYEAKRKYYLDMHMLVHKDVSEIEMYKCSLCTYETKYKSALKTHMLIHKDTSEIKMYKCSLCSYAGKQRYRLRRHMFVHQDVSVLKMHKCSLCVYEGKQESHLRKHMLVHNDVSELKMHKCSFCTYETKEKGDLKRHILIHMDVSEIQMHKCSFCTYETKQKRNLKKHMIIHKDASEIQMHKCSFCSYVAKQRSYLSKHMIVHKDVFKINMYKCSLCTFETKYKSNLKIHINGVHNGIMELKTSTCSSSLFEAKQKNAPN